MTTLMQLKLKDLKPGAAIGINSRKADAPVDGLMASIEAHGLLIPMLVRKQDGVFYVMDGNRRLAALQKLYGKKQDTEVPCVEYQQGNALELSMVVNIDRAGLHPVDRFEVFQALIDSGDTAEAIAKRYGLKLLQVRQALGLAKLAPEIRDAWRAGQIDAEAAEAFALTSDQKAQRAAFKKAGKHAQPWDIKRALTGGSDMNMSTMLKFVGRDKYEAAGHEVNESLFSRNEGDATVSDLPALRQMVFDAMDAECERLKSDGWKWAIRKDQAPNDSYSWRRHPDLKGKEHRATMGCIVSIEHDGKMKVETCIAKPGDKVSLPKSTKEKKKAAVEREKKKEESGGLSNALAHRLSVQLTGAVAEAVSTALSNDAIVSLAIAVLACAESPSTVTMNASYDEDGKSSASARYDNEFGRYFKLALGKTGPQRAEMLATWLGNSIDLTVHHATNLTDMMAGKDDRHQAKPLLKVMDAKRLEAAILKHFDAEDYFNSVSKELVWQAVDDALGKEESAKVAKMPAAEAKAYAIKRVKNWIPQALRLK